MTRRLRRSSSGIEPPEMARWLRLFWSIAIALVMGAFPLGAASAQEIGEAPAGAPGAAQRSAAPDPKAPALVTPHDVPVVLETARQSIPPVPTSYVTKDLGWLELSYPPSASERVASILRDADAVKAELADALGQPVLNRVTVRVAQTVADMARLAPADAPPPAYASGVAYNGLHLVLLSMLAPRGAEAVDLDEVFRHELAHVALEDAVRGQHVPLWFNEGLAIQLSGEHAATRLSTMWNATLAGTLIPLQDLDRGFPRENAEVSIAYAESADFMRFLLRRSDRLRFASMIERVRDGQPFERAAAEAYGSDLRKLEFQWRSDAERRYSIIPVLTGGGIVWVLVIGALVAAYVRRRRRAKAILAKWAEEEAIEDARLARLEAEQAGSTEGAPIDLARLGAARASADRVSIKVEHQGRWHTLH
jgi:peptidase MA superfamily protein